MHCLDGGGAIDCDGKVGVHFLVKYLDPLVHTPSHLHTLYSKVRLTLTFRRLSVLDAAEQMHGIRPEIAQVWKL